METHSRRRFTVPCSPAWIATPTSRAFRTRPVSPNQLASPAMPTNRRCSTTVFTGRRWLPAMPKLQIAKAATAIFMKSYRPAIPSPVPPESTFPRCAASATPRPIPGMAGKPALAYQESVHGKLVAAGNDKAAVCSDCHGTHDIRRAERSSLRRSSAPTFPRPAPSAIPVRQRSFAKSIHGKVLADGNTHAPVCTDCHGVHTIKAANDKVSSVSPKNQGDVACAQCHNNVRMTAGVRHSGRTHRQL